MVLKLVIDGKATDNLLYGSMVFSLLAFASLYQSTESLPVREGYWTSGFFVIHLASIASALSLIWMARVKRTFRLIGIAFYAATIFLVTVFGDAFGALSFGYNVPPDPIPEPQIASLFGRLERFHSRGAAPSGYTLRQWMSTLVGFYLVDTNMTPMSEMKKGIVKVLLAAAMIYVTSARLLRNTHTAFDLAVAIPLGTMAFWESLFLMQAILRRLYGKIVPRLKGQWLFTLWAFSVLFWVIFGTVSKVPSFWFLSIPIPIALHFVIDWLNNRKTYDTESA